MRGGRDVSSLSTTFRPKARLMLIKLRLNSDGLFIGDATVIDDEGLGAHAK